MMRTGMLVRACSKAGLARHGIESLLAFDEHRCTTLEFSQCKSFGDSWIPFPMRLPCWARDLRIQSRNGRYDSALRRFR